MINYLSGPFGALGDLLKDINRMSEDSEVHCTYRTSGDWCTSMAYIFQFCFLLVLPNKVLFSPESHKQLDQDEAQILNLRYDYLHFINVIN